METVDVMSFDLELDLDPLESIHARVAASLFSAKQNRTLHRTTLPKWPWAAAFDGPSSTRSHLQAIKLGWLFITRAATASNFIHASRDKTKNHSRITTHERPDTTTTGTNEIPSFIYTVTQVLEGLTFKDQVLLIIYMVLSCKLQASRTKAGLPQCIIPPTQLNLKPVSTQRKPGHLLHHMVLLFVRQACKIGRPSWRSKLEPTTADNREIRLVWVDAIPLTYAPPDIYRALNVCFLSTAHVHTT
jgi:hypothetical protein